MVRATHGTNDFGARFNEIQQNRLASYGRSMQPKNEPVIDDIIPPQDANTTSYQPGRVGAIPAVGLSFDRNPTKLARLDSTVAYSVNQLINADSHEQMLAQEALLRRTLAHDSSLDTQDLIRAKRYLSSKIADLHTEDPSTAPSPRAFEAYMTALRTVDTILDRRRTD